LHLREDLARRRALESVSSGSAAVKRRPVLELLDLAASQADTHLNTPHFADLRDALALGALARSKNDLLLVLDLIAAKEPRGGALDKVAVVRLDNLLEKFRDLGLRRRFGSSGLGLVVVGTGSQQTGGNHQSEEQLVGIVRGEDQIGVASLNDLLGLGSGQNRVANNGTESVNLGTKLDLDGLALLDLDSGLSLVALQGRVRGDIGAGGDGRGVGEALVDLLAAVDLGNLLLEKLVALLADGDDLLARNAELGDFGEDLLRDLSRGLVLRESIRVVEGVVYIGGTVSS
jgi:hypothetical protein